MSLGTFLTNALPWVTAGIQLLSTVKSYQSAKAIEKQGDFNRKVWEDEALASWRAYEDQAAILRDEQRMYLETAKAGYAKSGVILSGTPIEVLNDMVYRQERDQMALHNQAVAEHKRRSREAAQAEWQAHMQGNAIRSQALGNFGASLISTVGRYDYGSLWSKKSDEAHAATVAPTAPTKGKRYTTAQANAVPGARGWRPVRGFS